MIDTGFFVDCIDEETFNEAIETYEVTHIFEKDNLIIGVKGNTVE